MQDMFLQFDSLPDEFFELKCEQLYSLFRKPALIHLKGEKERPLFISTLLHGNETTGFYTLQNVLRNYRDKPLPRNVSIFLGNVEAAAEGQRMLDHQVDFNRVWPGTHEHYLAEAHMMKQVTDIMRDRQCFASIDIHNNTGRNPHYGCINVLDPASLGLAGLFSNTVVYFHTPKGVQSAAFADFCPSVTLECGQSNDMAGIDHASRFLEYVLQLDELSVDVGDHINLFHTVASVKIPDGYSFGFHGNSTINLYPEIENYNFRELEAGTLFACIEPESSAYFQAFDDDDREVGREYFEYRENDIVLRKPMMPSMLTTDTKIIRQDCLCYLMEKIGLDGKSV